MPLGYVLDAFPRLSETFILNEVLELERQDTRLRLFVQAPVAEPIVHGDVSRVRAPVERLPPPSMVGVPAATLAFLKLLPRAPARTAKGGIRTLRHPRTLVQAADLAERIRHGGIRHIHAHFAWVSTELALAAHRMTGVPFSFTAHGSDIYDSGVSRRDLAEKLRSARFVVTVSDYNRSYLEAIEPRARVVVIRNGLDLERFAIRSDALARPSPLLLAVGRLVEKKGYSDLVRACDILRRRGRSFECRIVGGGPLEGDLRSLVSTLGLANHVELVGPLPRERVLDLYREASVFVVPSHLEGLPTVLVEAMALGIPTVATEVTGIPELIEDERTGLLVPPGAPEDLARAIERILSEPGEAEHLARMARQRIERDYDVRKTVGGLRELFEASGAEGSRERQAASRRRAR